MRLMVWQRTVEGEEERIAGDEPLFLPGDGARPCPARERRGDDGIIVARARDTAGAVAAVLVFDDLARAVLQDGVPLCGGLHLVRHGAELTVRGQRYWISADAAPIESAYDPAQHGAGLSCHLTRAPLAPGEAIVACPGTLAAGCGLIHRAAAWRAAMDGGLSCSGCGFHAGGAEWRPPRKAREGRLDEPFGSAWGEAAE